MDKPIAKQSETFAARKAMLALVAESQAKEHAYYTAAAESVDKHMQALCSAWSTILGQLAREHSAAFTERFSSATGIGVDRLSAWLDTHRAYANAVAESAGAERALTVAEHGRARFAGRLWGAKNGFEQQYADADSIVKKAKATGERMQTRVTETERMLDTLSEALLRDCVGRSAAASTSAEFGTDIARILRAMQVEARALEQQHNEQQSKLLAGVGDALRSLRHRFGTP